MTVIEGAQLKASDPNGKCSLSFENWILICSCLDLIDSIFVVAALFTILFLFTFYKYSFFISMQEKRKAYFSSLKRPLYIILNKSSLLWSSIFISLFCVAYT